MNRQHLCEIFRLDPYKVPAEIEFWALYAVSFYERLFARMGDPKDMKAAYDRLKSSNKIKGKAREALEFFYLLRLDELENPDYWDRVGRTPKDKLVRESI